MLNQSCDPSEQPHRGLRAVGSPRVKHLAAALPERYVFRQEVGKGGAAYVILADDLERKHPVAVKILRPEVATAVGETRFHREIEILSHLDHPNILPLLDYGAINERVFFFTMPFVEGSTLRTRIRHEHCLSLNDTFAIAHDVSNALDYAHGRGLIHRDVKPANILLSGGRTLVADFGIARAMAVDRGDQITASGISLGTPEYMSPEQAGGIRQLDARCDVYALGCVVYEMLAGEPPFTGSTDQAIIAKHCHQPPASIRDLRPDVPRGVDAAIMKALSKVRAQRFYSAGKFVNALVAASGPT
ncbi:MAG: serine/threonine protein kinase [Gemmatimonadota bacterium]|nr:serine/threonine protein kinase [Gemmatimonadota bacterium]